MKNHKVCMVTQWCAAMLAFCAVLSGACRVTAGPQEADEIREWCAPFLSVEGVDVLWRYDMVTPPGVLAGPPYRERLVSCWDIGLLVETGGGIHRRPGDGRGKAEYEFSAQVSVTRPTQARTSLGWIPGTLTKPSLRREPVEFADDRRMRIVLSEYLIANYLIAEVPVAMLETASWTGRGENAKLSLVTEWYDFLWARDESSLHIISIIAKQKNGNILYRQEFDEHRMEPTLGGEVASKRRMFVLSEDDESYLQHVNTAVLEEIAFLAEVPRGFAELDTSNAMTIDLAAGIVYDDAGNKVGKIMKPTEDTQPLNWFAIVGIVGCGVIVGGGTLWWLRHRAG
ncbi:MAG: hypothetical protein Q9O74_02215 [Planctomycetota bacterium]|nr:hypothetical protein [Planctomycetota bacterium]